MAPHTFHQTSPTEPHPIDVAVVNFGVTAHLEHIRAKLGASRRSEIAAG
jgi:hypothetical protein